MEREFYIRNSDRELVKVSELEAKSHKSYGVKANKSGHIFISHTDCDDPTCHICNLDVCMVCGALEGALTTECCGEYLSMKDTDEVYEGKKDFRYGRWLPGVVNKIMIKNIETMKNNQRIILRVFEKDIDEGTELGEKIRRDISNELRRWGNLGVVTKSGGE